METWAFLSWRKQVGCSWVWSRFQIAVPWRDPLQEGDPWKDTGAAVLMLVRVRGHDPEVCLKTCINIFCQRPHSGSLAKQVCWR